MDKTTTPLVEAGKQAFQQGQYEQAATLFAQAAEQLTLAGDDLLAAEMKNNQSVALLQAGKAQQALQAAQGTETTFATAGDLKRQAMALGNQAAALEALHRFDEALQAYERSAELFAQAGESDLRATVMQSIAAIKLKRGQVTEAGIKMIGVIEAKQKLTLLERILRFFIRHLPW
jgi:tetratricopeptide (TPR) repeat protein